MNGTQALAAGLPDAVHDAQQAFRAVLDALARPGKIRVIGPALPGVALGGAMARLLLSLSDDDTPVWWQCEGTGLQRWLRFHVGAPVADAPAVASFAVFADLGQGFDLADFAAGTAAAPEFSTTLLIELPSLTDGPVLAWHGPGIQTVQRVGLQGLPANFWTQWQANHAAFPQGVDIIFTCGEAALGLPRTTRVRRLEGV
ncbi:MAG: phosphonate C-P lyase system protein PhnH [Rhodoferax sp.]|uniref:phosphonate C-P lyase system protein PhnH n=1 Tax=Rhodoferax sp. TaxID=50421 RepID=UPI00262CC45A|nr:phosphonate C-P lyase system protein PhnH [Rhodoferax sp.]MDD2880800.1 phosphonate C-P lyase system protein PhnH [Rhodoferax sp.]